MFSFPPVSPPIPYTPYILTSVRHLSLSWASPIQSIYPHPTSWRSILILSTHLLTLQHWKARASFSNAYLTPCLLAEIIQHSHNSTFENNIERKRSCLKMRYHTGIFVKELRKIMKRYNRHGHNTVHDLKTKLNSVALVRERSIPTERPPPVGEVSANFCG